MKTMSLASIIAEASKFPKKADKVKFLRDHESMHLKAIFVMALDPNMVWDLPPTAPPYTPNEILFDQEAVLFGEFRKMYLFFKGPNRVFGDEHNPNVRPQRREQMFIQLLENVQADDAEMLCAALQKKLHVKGLTPKIINEAFPGLLPIPEPVKAPKEEATVDG